MTFIGEVGSAVSYLQWLFNFNQTCIIRIIHIMYISTSSPAIMTIRWGKPNLITIQAVEVLSNYK